MDSLSKARAFFSKALPPPPPSKNSVGSSNSSSINNNSSKDVDTINIDTKVFPPRTISTRPPPSTLELPPTRLQEQVNPSLLQSDSVRSPIHRRPVALPSSPRPVAKAAPAAAEPSSLPSHNPTAPSPTSALEPQSPAHSLSSLISAYSRDSEEPAQSRLSLEKEGSKNSSHVSASSPLTSDDQTLASPYKLAPLDFKDSSSSGSMFGDKPPPPPIKDGAVPARKPLALSNNSNNNNNSSNNGAAAATVQLAVNSIQAPLPPTPRDDDRKPIQAPAEIWRRRSDKTDKPIEVSELKLTATNGSTSAPQIPTKPVQPMPAMSKSPLNPGHLQKPVASHLSASDSRLRSPQPLRSGGLPGRNIRPNATAETPTQNGSSVPTAANDTLSKTGTFNEARLVDGTPADDKKRENVTLQSQQDDAVRHIPDHRLQKQYQNQAAQQQQPVRSPSDAGIRRLPTPDYEQHDVKSPIVDHVVSPVSPASSPDLIGSYLEERKPLPRVPSSSSPEQAPTVPEKTPKASASSAATLPASSGPKMGNICTFPKSPRPRGADTKESSVSSTRASETIKAQHSVGAPSVIEKKAESSTRSLPNTGPSSAAKAEPTPATAVTSSQVQSPQNAQGQGQPPYSSPSAESGFNVNNAASPRDQFPARTTSRAQGLPSSPLARLNHQAQPLPQAASVTDAFLDSETNANQAPTSRLPTSQQPYQSHLLSPYEPRPPPPPPSDGTVYKELVQSDDFDPAIARFPATKLNSDYVLSGSIYKMRPLSRSQLNCYHRHRFMVPTSNANYSLACQTCGCEDSEDRFRCKFCYLRICISCKDILAQNRGDIDALMAHIKSPESVTTRSAISDSANVAGVPSFPVVTAPA